ncbi:MAG: hypothetical protein HQK76_07985 [Desulfobacterales bacterium]|nr:hypothetical protein [Desulfobacterales bacterium]
MDFYEALVRDEKKKNLAAKIIASVVFILIAAVMVGIYINGQSSRKAKNIVSACDEIANQLVESYSGKDKIKIAVLHFKGESGGKPLAEFFQTKLKRQMFLLMVN